MMSFQSICTQGRGRSIALAVALVCGTALGTVALEAPAYAQKKPKASKSFVKIYSPINDMVQAGNLPEAAAKIPDLLAAAKSDVEKNIAGGLIYNIGVKSSDNALLLQGIELMSNSGQADAERQGKLQWQAYQINRNEADWPAAREALNRVATGSYSPTAQLTDGTMKTFSSDDIKMLIAESYVDEENIPAAVNYLMDLAKQYEGAGQPVPERMLRRAMGISYDAEMKEETANFSAILVKSYPTKSNWSDAINRQRNLLYADEEMLDLLRLAMEKGTLSTQRDYIEYIDTADVLRRANEVKRVSEAGIASGILDGSNIVVAENLTSAKRRAGEEKADMAGLERDAKAASASGKLVMNVADSYLSQGNGPKAEEVYMVALQRNDVDKDTANTRLGMAQLMQGKKAEAQASFAKVQGKRKPIATLWGIYAAE